MAIALKLTYHDKFDNTNQTTANTDPHTCLSTNITRMRNKIKTEMELHPTKVMYINPVRAVIGLNNDNSNERDENEEEEGSKELSELRQTTELRSEKIETELIAVMTKEINKLKLINHNVDLVCATGNDLKNLNSVHSNTAYVIDDTNPNTHEFLSILNGLCKQFTCVWLIKCSVDDPYTDRFVILTADNINDDVSNTNDVSTDDPTNQAALIDFLYAVCATALTIIRLNKNEFRKHIKIVMQTLRNISH